MTRAALRHCTRPAVHGDDRLCFCPEPGRGYGVRQVLARPFINGWVNETWMRRAREASADPIRSEAELFAILWDIEDAANTAYALWRDCQ